MLISSLGEIIVCMYVLATDRGGHLHNALMLVNQLDTQPQAIVTTYGPDIDSVRNRFKKAEVISVPHLFTWLGKKRLLNPFKMIAQFFVTFIHVLRIRPTAVISLGGTNVVFFCYWARLLGAKIYHVECMNQVVSRSITGRMLYPICEKLYVQWEDLLPKYGPKAQYAGWVL
ncbi:MAG: hypothetical protein HY537_13925 [Deltaproteobacteria bacterium]|nr:hypothetical protein [Deltaproteobacteria bacterium]